MKHETSVGRLPPPHLDSQWGSISPGSGLTLTLVFQKASELELIFFLKKISIRVFFSYILTIGGIAGEVRGPSNFSLPPPSTYEQTDMYLQLYLWDDYHIFLFASHVISHLIDWWWNVNCVCNCYSSFFLFFFLLFSGWATKSFLVNVLS